MDSGRGAVVRLIEKATDSTDREVDQRLLKAIKSTVRSSDDELRAAVEALMSKMKKEHSQVRYLAVLIIDELFMRSKLFRSLFINSFDQFLSLSVGFRRNMPLPPPANIASILRSKSLELLEKWHGSFGVHYRQLRLSLDYLKNTLRYQLPNRLGNAERLQQERREREIRSREILQNKYEKLQENFSSIKAEIQSTLDQLGECLEIVCNKEGKFASCSSPEEDEPEEFTCLTLRQIRQQSLKEGEKVHENDENAAVFDALREFYKLLLSKHLPSVQEWISVLVRVDLADNKFRDSALKECIDVRNMIQSAKKKCEELGCVLPSTAQEEEEVDMWEEGKIEANDPVNASSLAATSSNSIDLQDTKVCVGRDTSVDTPVDLGHSDDVPSAEDASPNVSQSCTDSESPRSRLLAEAPVLKWGPFLESWGSTQDAMVNYRGLELESHWGRVEQDAIIPGERIAELSAHWSLYQEQAAEIRPCLAPLKNGGLCQRRDLTVCPFHGPIVPRDPNGNTILEEPEDGKDQVDNDRRDDPMKIPTEGAPLMNESKEKLSHSGDQLMKRLAEKAIRNVRGRDRESKSLKRAKIAKVREHNEAVLREAACSSTSLTSAAFVEEGMSSEQALLKPKKPSLSSMLRKKVTAKDRLAQRLLKSRLTDSAAKQITQAEDVNRREAFANQW
ncbi:unnamed protein product [Spirodela intermedia]|uniref:UV-stimulated scaffold protein A C-terminal domain-containing protein n=1 Tax=Spirodela intermedia TaxID=51605 RepID=A0A7I8KZJ3_SPIIN|nr:unnamed protein product [Spirodela intermedia]